MINISKVQRRLVAAKDKQRADLKIVLLQAREALLKIRTASIAGCDYGYGSPEKWADALFASHYDVTEAIRAIDQVMNND